MNFRIMLPKVFGFFNDNIFLPKFNTPTGKFLNSVCLCFDGV